MLLFTGCVNDAAPDLREWTARIDTVGDTVNVRTLHGHLWPSPMRLVPEFVIGSVNDDRQTSLGSVLALAVGPDSAVWLFDGQNMELRHYRADGIPQGTLGRPGAGPGEFRAPDGLAVLPDGRILLRDPGNTRFTLWARDRSSHEIWAERGGYQVSSPLVVDTAGRIASVRLHSGPDGEFRETLLLLSDAGLPLDSMLAPASAYQPPLLSAVAAPNSGTSSMQAILPYSPAFHWAYTPANDVVYGLSDRFRFYVQRPDGAIVRVERETAPVRVSQEERDSARARTERTLRQADPTWRWNGPDIPADKPAFRDIFASVDGRVWVLRSVAGTSPRPDDFVAASDTLFDVFEPDGRYLGSVLGPVGLAAFPAPVLGRRHVWAIVRDDLGVNFVVRFRVEPADSM